MATRSMFKIEFNGVLLPDIYFNYDQAKEQLHRLVKNNIASGGRVVNYDDQTGAIN